MEDIATVQDELYYTAKNFNKLKFSNTAYVQNTTKDKQENQKEIENLAKEYETMKKEVEELKKKSLYSANRIKSASAKQGVETNTLTILRLKLDQERSLKSRAREEWKKMEEKLKELKSESKLIVDDNNPYMRRIKLLENKLDKAMIKYNEAMSIRRTYEQILGKLKEERAGYDNQIAKIQESLKSKEHDCEEFKLLLQDAKQAKGYSEMLLKNTKLSKKAFEDHFKKLIEAHQSELSNDKRSDRFEENKKKTEKILIQKSFLSESSNQRTNNNLDNELRLKAYEEADKKIKEVTCADDINEICQKFSNLKETKEKLKKEKKDLEKMKDVMAKKKEELSSELNKLKFQGQDEITRKEIEDNEKAAERKLKSCEESRTKLKKSERIMVDIRAGINTLVDIIKNKIFEEIYSDESNFSDKEIIYRQAYSELANSSSSDLRHYLSKLNDISDFLYGKFKNFSDNYEFDEDRELNLKEDNEIEHIYLNQQIDSNQNSEYIQDDEDVDIDINSKDTVYKNDLNTASRRPHTTGVGKKKNTTRYTVKARDRK